MEEGGDLVTKRKTQATAWLEIGSVLVDTGCVAIGDPCRLVTSSTGTCSRKPANCTGR
jgi:hypothetical protein